MEACRRYGKALELREEAIQLDPNYVDAYYELGWACYQLGDGTPAVPASQEALELNPKLNGAEEVIEAFQE